jgi:hypothetical protein
MKFLITICIFAIFSNVNASDQINIKNKKNSINITIDKKQLTKDTKQIKESAKQTLDTSISFLKKHGTNGIKETKQILNKMFKDTVIEDKQNTPHNKKQSNNNNHNII